MAPECGSTVRPGGRCPLPVPARPRRRRACTTSVRSASSQRGGNGGRLDRRPPFVLLPLATSRTPVCGPGRREGRNRAEPPTSGAATCGLSCFTISLWGGPMLDTDPTARVDELEHDLADLDEVELPLEPHQNGGSAIDHGGRGDSGRGRCARAARRGADTARRPRGGRDRRPRRAAAADPAGTDPQAEGLRALPLDRDPVPGRAPRRRRRPVTDDADQRRLLRHLGRDRLVLRLDAGRRTGRVDHRDPRRGQGHRPLHVGRRGDGASR